MKNKFNKIISLTLAIIFLVQIAVPSMAYTLEGNQLIKTEAPKQSKTEILTSEGENVKDKETNSQEKLNKEKEVKEDLKKDETREEAKEEAKEELKDIKKFEIDSSLLSYKNYDDFIKNLRIIQFNNDQKEIYSYEEAIYNGINIEIKNFIDRVRVNVSKENFQSYTKDFQKDNNDMPQKSEQKDLGNIGVIKARLEDFIYTNEKTAKEEKREKGFFASLNLSVRFAKGLKKDEVFSIKLPEEIKLNVKDGYVGNIDELAQISLKDNTLIFTLTKDIDEENIKEFTLKAIENEKIVSPNLEKWIEDKKNIENIITKDLKFISNYNNKDTEIVEKQSINLSKDFQLENRLIQNYASNFTNKILLNLNNTENKDLKLVFTKNKENKNIWKDKKLEDILSIYQVETINGAILKNSEEKIWKNENSKLLVKETTEGFEISNINSPILLEIKNIDKKEFNEIGHINLEGDIKSLDEKYSIKEEDLSKVIDNNLIEIKNENLNDEATRNQDETQNETQNEDAINGEIKNENTITNTNETNVNFEKALEDVKASISSGKYNLEDFQRYMYSIAEVYKLSNEEVGKIYDLNRLSIEKLVEDYRKNNFKPLVLASRSANDYQGKKFNVKTRWDISTSAGPILVGQYFNIHLDRQLKVNDLST